MAGTPRGDRCELMLAGASRVDWWPTLVAATLSPVAGPVFYCLVLGAREFSGLDQPGPSTWLLLVYVLGLVVSYASTWTLGLLAHLLLAAWSKTSRTAYVVAFALASLPTWAAMQRFGPEMPFPALGSGLGLATSALGAAIVALLFRRIAFPPAMGRS